VRAHIPNHIPTFIGGACCHNLIPARPSQGANSQDVESVKESRMYKYLSMLDTLQHYLPFLAGITGSVKISDKIIQGFIGFTFVIAGGAVAGGLLIWKTLPLIEERLATHQSAFERHEEQGRVEHQKMMKGIDANQIGIRAFSAEYREGSLIHKLEDHR